ncbi:MAG: DUF4191 domain-containing protein [Propionibacteriaceae bacterium]|jgi:hypothetical protein|nr:DUF4191 domain-containing protein [Propionibacteriaceae bacterium]
MASERAKQAAEKAKAEAKAVREAKKKSEDPADWGWFRQMGETLKMTSQADPKNKFYLIGTVVGSIVIGFVVGLLLGHQWQGLIFGFLVSLSLFMLLLNRLAKTSVYSRYKGQPGYGQVGLMMLNKKKWTYTAAIEGNRQQDCVHRAVGPAGLILVADGDPTRVKPVLATAKRRHEGVAYGVPVIAIITGEGEGQIPVPKLADYINKLPKKLSTTDIAELEGRLRALDNMRGRAPIPKGPLPNVHVSRRALRGH